MLDDDLLIEFLNETKENLAAVDSGLVLLETTPDDAAILANVFRLVHTIKGTSGFLNLTRLGNIAHAAENVLGKVRDGKLAATPITITAVLKAIDRIKKVLVDLENNGKEPQADDSDVIGKLERIADGQTLEALEPEIVSPAASAESEQLFQRVRGQTIRVPIETLESLMNLVSELVLTRNQLVQLARATPGTVFDASIQRLSSCASQLQEGLMRTRMQPISQAWSQLPRVVRDLAFDLGKKVTLELSGEQTGLDRQVLELIKDPLTHMVRNAVDHGIEKPADRLARGKSQTGKIKLHAAQEGGFIIIRMSDDGQGIQTDRLGRKAVEQGLTTEAELAQMTEAQILRLIFRAGLSTAAETTTVSGRGVGMDVVKANIERIGGAIEILSSAGSGTEFLIRIPLTLAIVSALIVDAGGERFALAQSVATELVRTGDETGLHIETIHDAQVLRLRDELVPLVDLNRILGGTRSVEKSNGDFIAIVRVNRLTFGLIVDDVFDTEEIVVKPLAPVLRSIPLYSGATILGDGRVIMILDADGIAKTVLSHETETRDDTLEDEAVAGLEKKEQMLLVKIGAHGQAAVPLGLVKRIEDLKPERIEYAMKQPVVQYRNELIPIVSPSAEIVIGKNENQSVLMFSQGTRTFGLAVTQIMDVVDDFLEIQPAQLGSGIIGTCILNEKVTEILDIGYYFLKAFPHAQQNAEVTRQETAAEKPRLLLIDQNPFFRSLLKPLLMTAGYQVESAHSFADAHRDLLAGHQYDVILTDLDGLSIASGETIDQLRRASAETDPRVIALSASEAGLDKFSHLAREFDGWATKLDSQSLLDTVTRNVRNQRRSA
jgi:two-component system chemotaxis sensor kinase CheA